MSTRLASGLGRNHFRVESRYPLSDADILEHCPAVFADRPHESRSTKYAYVSTADIVRGLRKEGFEVFFAAQSRSMDEGMLGFTKHLLRMRHASQIEAPVANEIVMLGSHGGQSSIQLLAGGLRGMCMNRQVYGNVFADIRIPHKGRNVVDDVIEGTYSILGEFERADGMREAMKATMLSDSEVAAFGKAALELRWQEGKAPVSAADIVRVRRVEECKADLDTIYNVVQENLVDKGGQPGRAATGRRMTTRGVRGLDENVKINRALHTLAAEMLKLKA